jgi:hypothetical protein
MGEIFEKRNMEGAVFRDVNLAGAVFDDVNLAGGSIRDATLENFSIDDAYIKGMTIYGIRVDLLIEAELDRRDPERVRLRMDDPHDLESVKVMMDRLDELRAGFYDLLRSTEPRILTAQPGPDCWSVIEILRHLIFAEDLYLNRWILRNDQPWNPVGLLPTFIQDDPVYDGVGGEPTEDLEFILSAWDEIHAQMREVSARLTPDELRKDTSDTDFGQGTVGGILQGLARHDLSHIRDVEKLIRELEGE